MDASPVPPAQCPPRFYHRQPSGLQPQQAPQSPNAKCQMPVLWVSPLKATLPFTMPCPVHLPPTASEVATRTMAPATNPHQATNQLVTTISAQRLPLLSLLIFRRPGPPLASLHSSLFLPISYITDYADDDRPDDATAYVSLVFIGIVLFILVVGCLIRMCRPPRRYRHATHQHMP